MTGTVLAAGVLAVAGSLLAGRTVLPKNGFTVANGYPPLSLADEPTLRAAAGMTGLLALGAATLGASLAWIPPLTWTLLAWTLVLWPPPGGAGYQRVLAWMVQPAGSTSAALTAVTLGVAGILTYAIRGPGR